MHAWCTVRNGVWPFVPNSEKLRGECDVSDKDRPVTFNLETCQPTRLMPTTNKNQDPSHNSQRWTALLRFVMKLATTITLILSAIGQAASFAPVSTRAQAPRTSSLGANNFDDAEASKLQQFDFPISDSEQEKNSNLAGGMAPLAGAASLAFMPLSAEAASGTNQVASALFAYGHYLSLFVMVGALMFEKLTIEPGMSKEKETSLVVADATYGIAAVALLVTGYYRLVEYGKGWFFYSHEPIFWIKMIFFVFLGSASLFPTITSIKRFIAAKGDSWEPMSEKLANRMNSVINAELLMMASIPLSATLMSRGVGYTEAIPIEIIGPVLTGVTAVGLSFKYVKEALTWSEDE